MFQNLKPTFGAPANNTSFGFSSGVNANPFGQSTFGKPATSFGATTSTFGATAPIFGQAPQQNSLFGSSATTAAPNNFIGQNVSTQPTFGGGIFGTATSAQPTGTVAPGTAGGLFSNATAGSAFGQANKPATSFGFGATTSGTVPGTVASASGTATGATAGGSFFGQAANPMQPQTQTNLFGQATTNLFGTSFGSNLGANQMGTPIKFTPVTGTDTMVKGSINQTVNTRHHCITCMKEYESKSLEELRWEDYQLNRKGPQQGVVQPTNTLFGPQQSQTQMGATAPNVSGTTSLFGTPAPIGTTFGQPDNKPLFGSTATTGFGQPGASAFGVPSTTNQTTGLFGKPLTGFGTNANTAFPFTTSTQQSTSLFGTNTATTAGAKPFGQATNLFGQPATNTFGTPQPTFNAFGSTANQGINLFNQAKPSPFGGTGGTTFGTAFGGAQPVVSTQTQSLFGTPAKPAFGTSTGFGATTAPTSTSLFGQAPFGMTAAAQPNQSLFSSASSTFARPPAPLFGQANTTNTLGGGGLTLGGGLGTGTSLFNNPANKPNSLFGGLGSGLGTFNSTGFGTTNTNTAFNLGGTTMQPNMIGTLDTSNNNIEQQILSLSSTPYGLSSLLNNVPEIETDMKNTVRPTNPTELNALLESVNKSPLNTSIEKLQPQQIYGRKVPMFDGLETKDETLIHSFRINTNPKRLVIRNNRTNSLNNIINNNDDIQQQSPDFNTSLNRTENINTGPITLKKKLNLSLTSDIRNVQKPLFSSTMITSPTNISSNETTSERQLSDVTENRDETNETNTDNVDETNCSQNSSSTENEIENEDPPEPHPTGIILTRPEYYTVPSLDELVQYINEDGSCIVQGFTIGRIGYGSVYFTDAFDVSNLNLDELVHFRHKEITIYSDESTKPALGEGLNRRAQVTLDKVWPYDKQLKVLITDVDTLTNIRYGEKLRRLCEKQNTRFVEYRPETGSWVFKVDHFSKYGHRDSDDESDEEIVVATTVPSSMTTTAMTTAKGAQSLLTTTTTINAPVSKPISTSMHEEDEMFGLKDIVSNNSQQQRRLQTDVSENMYTSMNHYDDTSIYRRFRTNSASDIAKCALMKSTFSMNEIDDYDDNMSDVCSSEGGILELSNYVSKSSPKRVESQQEQFLPDICTMLDVYEENADNLCFYPEEPECVPDSLMIDSLPLSDSCINNYTLSNMVAFKGRSFKVGWGKNMTFFTLNSCNSLNSEQYTGTTQSINVMSIKERNNSNVFKKSIEEHLQCQLESSKCKLINDIPYFISDRSTELLERHEALMAHTTFNDYSKQVWDLCTILWGSIPEQDLHKYDNRVIRRRLLSDWFKRLTEPYVEESLAAAINQTDPFLNILIEMSGNRVSDAIELAFKTRNYHLAVFLAQLPSTCATRALLAQQLNEWCECGTGSVVDETVMKLYMLAAAKPYVQFIHNGRTKSLCVYQDMDWIRTLAMYLWYLVEPAKPLCDVVNIYENAFSTTQTIKPLPTYSYDENDIEKVNESFEPVYDLRYQLLKFYSDNGYPLAFVLNTASYTNDALDYQFSWFLMQTLSSLGHCDLSDSETVHMHTSFASQLEQLNMWHWSIFVLLFLKDAHMKRVLIMDVLERHVELHCDSSKEYRKKERMLVNEFQIPSEWIDSAKATKALLVANYNEAIFYLCYASQWKRAHDVVMEHFIPEHFLCYDYEFLIKFLTSISAHKNLIPNWDEAGGLILDFAKLGLHYNNMIATTTTGPDSGDHDRTLTPDTIRAMMLNICNRFNRFPQYTHMHDVCLTEMSGRAVLMLRKLLQQQQHNAERYSNKDIAAIMQMLPMTGDCLKQELNAIIVDVLNDGTQQLR